MRIRSRFLIVAACLVAATSAYAQSQPRKPKADTKALLATMGANVSRISPSLEHDRWDANVRLWEVYLTKPSPLSTESMQGMRVEYQTIVRIVAQLVGPDERERWVLNRDLWEMMLDANCTPPAATMEKMRPMLKAMAANLARIDAPGEKERWTANYELWMDLVR
jgi:hypothetical protein